MVRAPRQSDVEIQDLNKLQLLDLQSCITNQDQEYTQKVHCCRELGLYVVSLTLVQQTDTWELALLHIFQGQLAYFESVLKSKISKCVKSCLCN